jgi:hypothetical protein
MIRVPTLPKQGFLHLKIRLPTLPTQGFQRLRIILPSPPIGGFLHLKIRLLTGVHFLQGFTAPEDQITFSSYRRLPAPEDQIPYMITFFTGLNCT